MLKLLVLSFALHATSAFAHNGDHTHIDLSVMLNHLLEPDHLIMIGMVVIAVFFASNRYRIARKAVAVKKDNHHEAR